MLYKIKQCDIIVPVELADLTKNNFYQIYGNTSGCLINVNNTDITILPNSVMYIDINSFSGGSGCFFIGNGIDVTNGSEELAYAKEIVDVNCNTSIINFVFDNLSNTLQFTPTISSNMSNVSNLNNINEINIKINNNLIPNGNYNFIINSGDLVDVTISKITNNLPSSFSLNGVLI